MNGLWQFFSGTNYCQGEPEPPPFGPFKVLGDYVIEAKENNIPAKRFILLKPEEECFLPTYENYVVEFPKKLIATGLVSFERKGSVPRIRVQLTRYESGLRYCLLELKNDNRPVHEYVLYEEQVEGTWIPIEVDGEELRP